MKQVKASENCINGYGGIGGLLITYSALGPLDYFFIIILFFFIRTKVEIQETQESNTELILGS